MRIYKYLIILICGLISSCCDTNIIVTGKVHNATCAAPNSGAITQTLDPPCTFVGHSWAPGGATTLNLTGLTPIYPQRYVDNISYNLGLTTPPYFQSLSLQNAYDLLYDMSWIQLKNMSFASPGQSIYQSGSATGSAASENVLPANTLGYLQFHVSPTIYPFYTMNSKIGLNDMGKYATGDISQLTGFQFSLYLHSLNGGPVTVIATYQMLYKGQVLHDIHGISTFNFSITDSFKVVYNSNGVQYFQNNASVLSHSVYQFTHPDLYVAANIPGTAFSFTRVEATFGCSSVGNEFAELSKTLNSSFYLMTNNVKFKYNEKYNDNILNYVIYDWQRNPVVSYPATIGSSAVIAPSVTNKEGINYHTIPTAGALHSTGMYTLEVTNSKNEVYQMRFQYYYYEVASWNQVVIKPGFPGNIRPGPVIGPPVINTTGFIQYGDY